MSNRVITAVAVFLIAVPIFAGDLKQLTDDGRLKRDPVFWPDGKSIVYTVEQPSGRMKLVRLNLSSGSTDFVHPDGSLSDRELTVSQNGNTYAWNVITGGKGITTEIRITRTEPPAVLKVPVKGWSHWPSISSDGRRVVFSENGETVYLFHINFDDVQYRDDLPRKNDEKKDKDKKKKKEDPKKKAMESGKLQQLVRNAMWPRFSPDGTCVAYVSCKDNDLEIYSIDVPGGIEQQLTESRGMDARPTWSPDGRRIAFMSNRDGNFELYVMNADGSGLRRLTEHPERDDFPAWHPDGKSLVFTGERDGALDLYLMDVGAE